VAAGLAGSYWLEDARVLQLFWQAQTFLAEEWRFPDLQSHSTAGERQLPALAKPPWPWLSAVIVHNRQLF